jgi:hypothetical protein
MIYVIINPEWKHNTIRDHAAGPSILLKEKYEQIEHNLRQIFAILPADFMNDAHLHPSILPICHPHQHTHFHYALLPLPSQTPLSHHLSALTLPSGIGEGSESKTA